MSQTHDWPILGTYKIWHEGKGYTYKKISQDLGISVMAVKKRVLKKWTPYEILTTPARAMPDRLRQKRYGTGKPRGRPPKQIPVAEAWPPPIRGISTTYAISHDWRTLTCISCRHYRLTQCAINGYGYPNQTHTTCDSFDYEPGVDESDWVRDEKRRDHDIRKALYYLNCGL